jgi:hypothetical protein
MLKNKYINNKLKRWLIKVIERVRRVLRIMIKRMLVMLK